MLRDWFQVNSMKKNEFLRRNKLIGLNPQINLSYLQKSRGVLTLLLIYMGKMHQSKNRT